MSKRRQLVLNLLLSSTGVHDMSWRHAKAQPERLTDLSLYKEYAQLAEAAKFHAIFLADDLRIHPFISHQSIGGRLEPLTLLSALAAVTERIGLIGTVSTAYAEPYNVARQFASLDHLSGGRAGWNIVTTNNNPAARQNFTDQAPPGHDEAYERAQEFTQVVAKLWDSWEDEAPVFDKATGIYVDTAKVHPIHHQGAHFAVKGPLSMPRPPQGRPVFVQAGASEAGRSFAARNAEIIYTVQQTLPEALAFYSDVKGRLAAYGRQPDELLIIPGIAPVVAETEELAREKEAELQQLLDVNVGARKLSAHLGVDLTQYPLDGPLPDLSASSSGQVTKTWHEVVKRIGEHEQLTIRQLIHRIAGGNGHRTIAGTPEQIADQLESWFAGGGADGFTIRPQLMPDGLSDFVRLVVPELQRRGLFHEDYSGATLREHLGLTRPSSRYTAQQVT